MAKAHRTRLLERLLRLDREHAVIAAVEECQSSKRAEVQLEAELLPATDWYQEQRDHKQEAGKQTHA